MLIENCESIQAVIREHVREQIQVRSFDKDTCILQTPFYDHSGDPIEMAVSVRGNVVFLDDTGTIAGHLFSLGQDTTNTPAFKLLESLVRAYGLELDHDEEVVKHTVPLDNLFEGVMDLGKVILTVVTAMPFMRVQPRQDGMHGQQVRTKIREE